jgi:hypothetical protein
MNLEDRILEVLDRLDEHRARRAERLDGKLHRLARGVAAVDLAVSEYHRKGEDDFYKFVPPPSVEEAA